jgi:hypothetical protein
MGNAGERRKEEGGNHIGTPIKIKVSIKIIAVTTAKRCKTAY